MKMKSAITKRCIVCHRTFNPDKRTEKRQQVCGDIECKVKHKRIANQQWRNQQENIDYFTGRYSYLLSWLEKHPDYLKNYRYQKKRNKKQKSGDIQDELTPHNNSKLADYTITILNDIQVELNTKINNKVNQLKRYDEILIYKSN